ncbi:MAG: secretin N-terminal domain-containing protein, partial [Phycisphaerales bacterium JB038]
MMGSIDGRSNSLMVVAAAEEMVRFLSIVDELQQTLGPPQDIQLYNLQHADAAEIVQFLTDLLESSQPFRTAAGRDPIIEAIEANNSLLIAADETQHAIIRALVDSMDVISTDELPPLRILQLRAADASNLARALSDVYDRRPSEQRAKMPVSIRADANSNTLLVSAHPELFSEIEQIVTDLNMAGGISREGREIRIFPLKFAKAEELAETIDEMYPEPPVPVDYRGRPLPQARPEREVRVRADKFTNSIIVDASMQRMAGFEQLVNALDKREIPEDIEMRTYTIVSADLEVVSNTVRKLAEAGSLMPGAPLGAMSTPITVEVEPTSRTLIVSGPQAMFPEVEKLLAEIDAQGELPTMVMRFYKLEHTRADQIRDMLQQLLASQIRETLLKDGAPESRVEALLEVTADPRSNTLIIRAPEWITPVADQLIEQLDDPLAAIGRPVIRIIALTFADAASVAESLNRSLPNIEMPSGESVQVLAAAGSNALILTGREKDLGKVEEMVQALDSRPSLDAINVETFPLKYADATTIADTVERLLVDQQMQDPRMLQYLIRYSRGPLANQPRVQVEADVRTNTLIVSARQQTLALASDIIEQLDREPDAPARQMAVFTPKRGRSVQIADLARRVLEDTASESLRERVELLAEPQSTAVLVLGTEQQIAEAMDLLQTFDDQAASAPMMDLQIVDIAHLAAPALAQTLGPMLTDQNRWPAELRALAQAGVNIARPTVTADAAMNRLLISAPAPLMDVARMLITQLDAPPPDTGASMLVRVFPLTSSKADTVAVTLQSALDAKLRSARLPANAPKPVITAEPSSNAIVVTATSEHMDEVESLLLPLDVAADPEQLQVQTVYLQHARAENVAPVVEQLLAPEQIDSWIRMQAYVRGREFDTGPDVRVAAEPRLNAIVITAPASVLKVAAEMVTQLDSDPTELAAGPQRLIRVLSFNNADAGQLAQNLEAVFVDVESGDPPPVIRVDAGSNSLIVRGTSEQLATIEEIAMQLDRATIASQRQMRMIPIDPSRANARELAETLQRILQDRSGGAAVEVITVEELMERHDGQGRGEESEEATRTIGSAGEAAPAPFCLTLPEVILSCVFAQPGEEAAPAEEVLPPVQSEEEGEPPLTIAVDESTNSLIVVGSPRLTDRLAQLATEIQQQMPAEPGRVRIIALPKLVDARNMANLLTATVRNIGQRSLSNPGGFTGRVAVIPDPAGGSIVVSANDTDFERVGELIAALAKPSAAGDVVVKVYGLKTITAAQASARVQDLFGAARGRQAQVARAQYMELEGDKFLVEPGSVQVVANSISEQLIVVAPPQTVPLIDRFVMLIDQTSSGERVAIRRFELENAEARTAASSLQSAFDARRTARGNQEPVRARFIADQRTNTLLVAASDEQFLEVEVLLEEIDRTLEDDEYPLTIVAVQTALPSRVAQVAQEVIFAKDPGIKTRTTVVADDDSGLILVRAAEEEVALLEELAEKLDQTPGRNVPVHTVALENADAGRVAAAIEDFLSRRERIASAAGRTRRSSQPKVAVIGDARTQSLIIAAADEDYAEIQQLLETLDAPGGIGELQFRVYPLAHAQATDMRETLQELVDELGWMNRWSGSGNDSDRILLRTDTRLNAVIVIGEGDSFRLVEELLAVVDVPKPEGAAVAVRIARLENADMRLVQQAVQQAVGGGDSGRNFWYWPPRSDTGAFTVHMDLQGR